MDIGYWPFVIVPSPPFKVLLSVFMYLPCPLVPVNGEGRTMNFKSLFFKVYLDIWVRVAPGSGFLYKSSTNK